MPTYEYLCLKCGRSFDALQPISAPPLKKCETCGGKVERQIGSGAGLIFKGTGFYITDYKRKGSSEPSSKKDKSGK